MFSSSSLYWISKVQNNTYKQLWNYYILIIWIYIVQRDHLTLAVKLIDNFSHLLVTTGYVIKKQNHLKHVINIKKRHQLLIKMYCQNTWSRFRVFSVGVRIFKYFLFILCFLWFVFVYPECHISWTHKLEFYIWLYIYFLNVSHVYFKKDFLLSANTKPTVRE